jgi:hypothetical protein
MKKNDYNRLKKLKLRIKNISGESDYFCVDLFEAVNAFKFENDGVKTDDRVGGKPMLK